MDRTSVQCTAKSNGIRACQNPCFCIVRNFIFWKSEFEKKHFYFQAFCEWCLPTPCRYLVKLVCCLISADSNSNEVVKTVSFIEHPDASDATASEIPDLRTDQQELIWWKSEKPETFQINPSHSINLHFLMKSCIARKFLVNSKHSTVPYGARCLEVMVRDSVQDEEHFMSMFIVKFL